MLKRVGLVKMEGLAKKGGWVCKVGFDAWA